MPKNFYLKIISPEEVRFEGEIEGMVLPGSSGSLGVYYDHAPIVSKLGEGKIEIKTGSGSGHSFAVKNGFLHMEENQATVLIG